MIIDASPLWTKIFQTKLRGLCLAREKGWLLTWDKNHWLYLLNASGEVQAQVRCEEPIVSAAFADNGSALAVLGQNGLVRGYRLDLSQHWHRSLNLAPLALAWEPFGDLLAVADSKGSLHLFGSDGKLVGQVQSPRPLHHLAFAPSAPHLIGCSDFGLVGAFDLKGNWIWRDAPVVHTGNMAVAGNGSSILLASFSEGIAHYDGHGKKSNTLTLFEPCPLVAVSFAGDLVLAAGMSPTLYFLDPTGHKLAQYTTEKPTQALALAALGNHAYIVSKEGDLTRLKLEKR